MRNLRYGWSRASFSLFAGALVLIFIMPLIYMFSAAFSDPVTIVTPGAPLYPSLSRTYVCTDPVACSYKTGYWTNGPDGAGTKWVENDQAASELNNKLPLYNVPGHGQLALLQALDPAIKRPSVFIDPATKQQVLVTNVNIEELSQVFDFSVTLDNFGTAAGWADNITAGNVSKSTPIIGDLGGFPRFFLNTAVIAILGTIGATLSAIIVAFGFARFKIPGRDVLFLVLIGTILLPFQVLLIPQFIIYKAIGWGGTWLPLIVPTYFSNAYNVFLLRQYFLTLPRELDEAAMMDGASPIRILISVIIPQSWPAIISVVLFHFFFAWNDFLAPLVYLVGQADLYPIAIGLSYFNTTYRSNNAPSAIQAGALISLIIPVIIFFLAQRVFMRGVVISGVEK
jgi:multiple sugar transport system permease protein